MANNIKLSTTSSIVDYLGTQGKDSSFSSRKKLYEEMGLKDRLGDYMGSTVQNTNFLKALRSQTASQETPFYPTPTGAPTPTMAAQNAVNAAAQPTPPVATPTVNVASTPTTPPISTPPTTTATQALGAFGYQPPALPTAEEVTSQVEGSPGFQLFQEGQTADQRKAIAKAETDKQALNLRAEQDTKEIKANLTNRGLASSSFMVEGIKSIADNLATSVLGVDRELAETLLSEDRETRGKFLDLAADVVKGAEEGNKQELEQLNKAGYAYYGGTLLPTVEAMRLANDYSSIKSVNGGLFDLRNNKWIVAPKSETDMGSLPTSFKEWQLAGGEEGTGKSYGEWVSSSKPPTSAQSTVAGYASRLEQAEPTFRSLQKDIQNMNIVSFEAQVRLPAAAQSATIQQYMQAARNFINAILRRESGAVISPTEFSEARQQYLPQPSDSPETIKLKEQNRKLVFASLRNAAGPAYYSVEELIGETGGGVLTSPDGTQEIDTSELTPEQIQEAKDAGWQ